MLLLVLWIAGVWWVALVALLAVFMLRIGLLWIAGCTLIVGGRAALWVVGLLYVALAGVL